MTEDQKLSKIALKEANKFIKIKTINGGHYTSDDVANVAKIFYQFLKQK